MRIVGLRLVNWGRYRGIHELELGAGAYAVLARHEQDQGRSNWLGKSWLLGAVWFALTGERPAGVRYEDDWISTGEAEGGVELELDDGAFISRLRKRGQSTQLDLSHPSIPDGGTAAQARAQEIIDGIVGFSREDSRATWFAEQREVARLVRMIPSERNEVFLQWTGLGRVEHAVELRVADMGKYSTEVEHIDRQLDAAKAKAEVDVPALRELLEAAERAVQEHDERTRAYRQDLDKWKAQQRIGQQAARRDAVRSELAGIDEKGAALEVTLADAAAEGADKRVSEALGRERELHGDASTKRRLAVGQFDGVCPVGGIQCPARDQLNQDRTHNAALLDSADGAWRTAYDALNAAKADKAKADKRRHAAQQPAAQVAALRRELATLDAALSAAGIAPVDEPQLPEGSAGTLGAEAQRVRGQIADAERALAEVTRLGQEREKWLRVREVATTAVVVLENAQRRVASRSIGRIERDANGILTRAGIPLEVGVAWERESKKPADHCRQCGQLFPASRKARECAGCGAPRGNKVERSVDVKLSSVSGGAEDLAGFALQMAAFAYLKRARAAGWGVLMVDEPFGALDQTNGASIARYLDGMLRSLDGVEQALVVSHDQALLDALPGRILITGDDEWSRVEVVA